MMEKKKKRILFGALAVILFIGIASAGTMYYYLFTPQFHPQKTVYIYIDRDDTTDSIYNKIKAQGKPNSFNGFKWMSQWRDYSGNIHTGRYAIRPGENVYHVFNRFYRGYQAPMNLTIGSVRTLDRLFIPETYQVYWNMSVEDFLERMQKEHQKFWNRERLNKAKAIGMTQEEVCTLASIVEEETNNNQEKPMIAGLYINRIHAGMPLQADPTIKFALQDFSLRRIANAHLTIDSPYNTYRNLGLPPGPIRIPTPIGIDAVLNYTRHNYIYMCAKEDFSGTHNFAANYAEHMKNARKYWKALNERKIFN